MQQNQLDDLRDSGFGPQARALAVAFDSQGFKMASTGCHLRFSKPTSTGVYVGKKGALRNGDTLQSSRATTQLYKDSCVTKGLDIIQQQGLRG